MRIDLTPAFVAAMEDNSRAPIQYLHMIFDDLTLYLSDRAITIDGQEYEPLVEDWGELTTAGSGSNDIIAETLQISISLWNGGEFPLSNHFLLRDPVNVAVKIYQTFDGLDPADAALVLDGVAQDPIEISEASRLIVLDVVSLNMRYQANVGRVLTRDDYPEALEADINKGLDLIVGDAGEVQCLAAKVPLQCTQKGSILTLKTVINTHEDLDEIGFPEYGLLAIDDEIMTYSSRTATSFNISARGLSGTKAVEHSDGATILQSINDHTYIIGQGPLSSVSDVRAGGLPVAISDYVEDLTSDPAILTFTKQPSFVSYSRGARSDVVDFDDVGAANTAWQPHYSYDTEYKSYGATISENNPTLAIVQTDTATDAGEVVRAFLSVEHWETRPMPNDYVEVWVEGIGTVGRLSRPNEADVTEVSGEIDIDHGHTHIMGGNHDHGFDNPNLDTSNPSHDHPATLEGPSYSDSTTRGLPLYTDSTYSTSRYYSFSFPRTYSNVVAQRVTINFSNSGTGKVALRSNATSGTIVTWGEGVSVNQTVSLPSGDFPDYKLYLYIYSGGVFGARLKVNTFTSTFVTKGSVGSRTTSIDAYHTSTGDVEYRNSDTVGNLIKDVDDVNNYTGANRVLQEISTTTSSKKVTDRFDLTKHLETIDWAWFTGRDVQIRYVGTLNNAECVITYANFEVEYRQRQTTVTNAITCRPVGSLGNRPDEVVQYLLNQVAGVPLTALGSISLNPEVWDDTEIWDDTEVWKDSGESLPAPTGAAFVDAANRYSYLGYTLDGVIPAKSTVQDVIKEICRQARARVVWSAGQVKMAVREKLDNWVPIKELDREHLKLKSLVVKKESVSKIRNDIDLFYRVDRLSEASDEGGYSATASAQDLDSIARNGQRKFNEEWLFDLVRNDAMALDLVDYYLWRMGQSATIYEWTAYLQQFDLEKEDVIRLSSDFFRLTKVPLKIIDFKRVFGSGKLERINTLRYSGEAVRQRLLTLQLNDVVNVYDEDLQIDLGTEYSAMDQAIVGEILDVHPFVTLADSCALGDSLVMVAAFAPSPIDTVYPVEELVTTQAFELEDTVVVVEDFNLSQELCFGSCGFGGTGDCAISFGSKTEHWTRPLELLGVSDSLTMVASFVLELEDTATVTDDPLVRASLGDDVTFNEELLFNSCFGCPVDGATGFGLSLFGR